MSDDLLITETKVVAFKIVTALKQFDKYELSTKKQLLNMTMARVNRMINGEVVIVDGANLTRDVDEPINSEPINSEPINSEPI